MTKIRIYQLDLFRFIAAMAVMAFHYLFIGPSLKLYSAFPDWLASASTYGHLGVELFFMISGFVIVMSAENQTWKNFLKGRFIRLFPLFWAACSITWVMSKVLDAPEPLLTDTFTYLTNLGMLTPHLFHTKWVDGVYWTLTYEWFFYFGIAALLAIGHFHRQLWRYLAAWLVCSLILLSLSKPDSAHVLKALRFFTGADYAAYFVAGVCFYRIALSRAVAMDLYILAFSYLCAMKSLMVQYSEVAQSHFTAGSAGIAQFVVSVFFGLFFLLSTGKLEFLNRRVFLKLGVLTYGLYLTHSVIGYIIIAHFNKTLGKPLSLVVAVLIVLMLSLLLHASVERPAYRWLTQRMNKSSSR